MSRSALCWKDGIPLSTFLMSDKFIKDSETPVYIKALQGHSGGEKKGLDGHRCGLADSADTYKSVVQLGIQPQFGFHPPQRPQVEDLNATRTHEDCTAISA